MAFWKRKPDEEQSKLVTIFSALGDQTRFRLVRILAQKDEICVSELANEVGITPAGASQHLKILEQSGLIKRNRMGQKICYTIIRTNNVNKRIVEMVLG